MTTTDPRAPMPAAPMRYDPDGSVAWGEMWDSFCALALDGGPPHRPAMLGPDPTSAGDPAYAGVVAEICRGVQAVSGLEAAPAEPGWIAVRCASPAMAAWLHEAILCENVAAQATGPLLLVPAGAGYTLKGEIKSVITAVAKTTHYWREHLPHEVKSALAARQGLAALRAQLGRWLGWPRRGAPNAR